MSDPDVKRIVERIANKIDNALLEEIKKYDESNNKKDSAEKMNELTDSVHKLFAEKLEIANKGFYEVDRFINNIDLYNKNYVRDQVLSITEEYRKKLWTGT